MKLASGHSASEPKPMGHDMWSDLYDVIKQSKWKDYGITDLTLDLEPKLVEVPVHDEPDGTEVVGSEDDSWNQEDATLDDVPDNVVCDDELGLQEQPVKEEGVEEAQDMESLPDPTEDVQKDSGIQFITVEYV